MSVLQSDIIEIRTLIDEWIIRRDGGDWEGFADLWHPEGRMITSWYQASAADFIARSRKAWDGGMKVFHSVGGSRIDVEGDRAIAETRMQIIQRAPVHDILVDVVCIGRFWDVLERTVAGWRLRLRQPIYDMDHMVGVIPGLVPVLNAEIMESFPEGYRHLAYLQTQMGMEVNKTLPGARGTALAKLSEIGRRWLAGDDATCIDAIGA